MSAAKKLIKALPVEEEVPEEEVVVEEEETVAEAPEGSGSEATELNPAELVLARIDAIEELLADLKRDARKLLKGKLPKRQTNRPKGETPKQVAEWNTFVAETLTRMESEGWPEFTTKKGKTVPAGVESEDGKWVFVDEDGKTRLPAYRDALAYAAHLKTETEDPEEKAAAKAAAEAEKLRKREEAKAEKAKQRAEEKARKAAEKAAEKEAEKERKAAEKAAEKAKADAEKLKAKELATKAVLAKVAKPVVAAAPAAAAKPAAKPVLAKPAAAPAAPKANGGAGKSPAAAPKPAPAAAAAPAAPQAVEDMTARKWVFKGKTYFKTPAGDCWVMNSDKSQGPWAGRYDPVADVIDETAEEPEYESDDE